MIYTVTARQEERNWLATVTNLEGAHTFAKSLSRLDANVRELIALIEDLPEGAEGDLNVEWTIHDAPDIVLSAKRVGEARLAAQQAMRQVELDTKQKVHELTQQGYSQRDQAFLLGVTPGRIAQLVSS